MSVLHLADFFQMWNTRTYIVTCRVDRTQLNTDMAAIANEDAETFLMVLVKEKGFQLDITDMVDVKSGLHSSKFVLSMGAGAGLIQCVSGLWSTKAMARRETAHLMLNHAQLLKALRVGYDARRRTWCPCSLCRRARS